MTFHLTLESVYHAVHNIMISRLWIQGVNLEFNAIISLQYILSKRDRLYISVPLTYFFDTTLQKTVFFSQILYQNFEFHLN